MIKVAVFLFAAAISIATMAIAAQLPMVPYSDGAGGPALHGGLTGPMVPNSTGGEPPPPTGCTGAADLSDGCAVAIFGH